MNTIGVIMSKLIKNIIFLLFGCFLVILITPLTAKEFWMASFYEKHDYKSFSELPAANQRIDMDDIDYRLLHAAVFYETNRQRALNGRSQLKHSPALEECASGYSNDMVKHKFFSHYSHNAGKETVEKRLAAVGIKRAYYGENITLSFGIEYIPGKRLYTPEQNGGYFSYTFKGKPILNYTYRGLAIDVVARWMDSPGHRKNILDPGFSYLGAGAARYKDRDFVNIDMFKVTQNFSDRKEQTTANAH